MMIDNDADVYCRTELDLFQILVVFYIFEFIFVGLAY